MGSTTRRYDQFLPTFVGLATNYSYMALRYALENKDRPPFSTTLSDTNLQTFRVVVEK